jgi:hypothetical protein
MQHFEMIRPCLEQPRVPAFGTGKISLAMQTDSLIERLRWIEHFSACLLRIWARFAALRVSRSTAAHGIADRRSAQAAPGDAGYAEML